METLMLYPKQDGLNQIYTTRVVFWGEFLHCDKQLFWDFLGEFSFSVEIRIKKFYENERNCQILGNHNFFISKKSRYSSEMIKVSIFF